MYISLSILLRQITAATLLFCPAQCLNSRVGCGGWTPQFLALPPLPCYPRGSIPTPSKALTLCTVCIQLKTQMKKTAAVFQKMINDLLLSEKHKYCYTTRKWALIFFNPLSYLLTIIQALAQALLCTYKLLLYSCICFSG